jgi:hypothetical protein
VLVGISVRSRLDESRRRAIKFHVPELNLDLIASGLRRHRGAALDAAGHLGGRIDGPVVSLALRAGPLPPPLPHAEAGAHARDFSLHCAEPVTVPQQAAW